MTFSELKQKDVINVCDGRKLGKPIDLILNESSCVAALVVPAACSLLNLIRQEKEGSIIPWECVLRIGDDTILVEIRDSEKMSAE